MDRFFTLFAGGRVVRSLAALGSWSLFCCGYAQAQDTALPPVQKPAYRSVFEGYQPLTELKLTPWPAANETVREVGGWRAYAKEAAAANAAAAAATSAPQPPPSSADTPQP
jgi:hypothetical protein